MLRSGCRWADMGGDKFVGEDGWGWVWRMVMGVAGMCARERGGYGRR